ncbi:MAG TPA: ATP-dependent DNA helicase RecQ [Bacteroidales bacterium]|nr:ATP-dependent DNA helicase RecQ [Bacteroidales bacterium]
MTDFQQILTRYWGYSKFRPLQEEIIRSVYDGHDTLGLMPTGGGKSLTFQVPAMAMDGICLVITPLIALMKDQVGNLKKRGIRATAIHSGLSREEIDITFDNCIYGDYKFLYLSPERLSTDLFRVRVEKMNVCIVAIDESHCVSQWGYDFRPSYLTIAHLHELLPGVPFLALTATATPKVLDDIMDRLAFREKRVFRKSFERKNITYRVDHVEDKLRRLLLIAKDHNGSGIVYVRSRKKTREMALFLRHNHISADYYHAGLSHEIRSRRQEEWQSGKSRVIVATNAFGMGIDKPDVRFVVHTDLPDSPEAYFQEAGRAGRDEKPALAVLLYNESDKRQAQQRIATTFPEIQVVKNVYNALGNYFQLATGSGKGLSFDFILSDFLAKYHFNALVAHNSLQILQREGYIEMSDEINNPSRVHFKIDRDDLYKFQVSNAQFDGFIKLMMRSYTGLFSTFVPVDEHLLARRSGLTEENIYAYLVKLSSYGIINYIPRKRNPVITYTEERLDVRNLQFSVDTYRFLKDRYIERINAMVGYASGTTKCRSSFFLEYFGEKDPPRCGQCDVCQERNELDLSKYEFGLISNAIQENLDRKAMSITELAEQVKLPEQKFSRVFRWLLDHGKIEKSGDTTFTWRES